MPYENVHKYFIETGDYTWGGQKLAVYGEKMYGLFKIYVS